MARASSDGRLEVIELGATYDEPPATVFSEVSLCVAPGQVLGIFGPNGCGKTTLLRAIAGLHTATTGATSLPRGPDTRIAWIPQDYRQSFFGWASLELNLVMTAPGALSSYRATAAAVRRTRDQLGLELDLSLRPSRCSGGMVQQAALLRALVSEPDLLLADEPFSALDVGIARSLRRSFRAHVVSSGMIALLVLHDLTSLVELCDRVLVIPDKPYTTRSSDTHAEAVVLDNRLLHRQPDERTAEDASFLELMKRVLDGGAHG